MPIAMYTQKVVQCINQRCNTVSIDTSCQEAITMLNQHNLTSLLVIQDAAIVGIVTEQDVCRRMCYLDTANKPISEVMTKNVITIQAEDYLYQAVALMLAYKLSQLPVLDLQNQLIGTVKLVDVLLFASTNKSDQLHQLTAIDSLQGMLKIKQFQQTVISDLHHQQLPALQIIEVIDCFNKNIYQHSIDLVIQDMQQQGWGGPPVKFAVIVMGSAGRGESFLDTDQDNGFILEDYGLEDHNSVDAWFRECAQRFCDLLDTLGFACCTGNIMALNPQWRKPYSEWLEQIKGWLKNKTIYAQRYVDIFADFKWVAGESSLVERLRSELIAQLGSHPYFMTELVEYDQSGKALNWLGNIRTEPASHAYRGHINLKHYALTPMTHCLRILAIKKGIQETSSLRRLKKLQTMGLISADLADQLEFSLAHLTELIVQAQLHQAKHNQPYSKYVEPKKLAIMDRRLLKQSLQAVQELRQLTREFFTGQLV